MLKSSKRIYGGANCVMNPDGQQVGTWSAQFASLVSVNILLNRRCIIEEYTRGHTCSNANIL